MKKNIQILLLISVYSINAYSTDTLNSIGQFKNLKASPGQEVYFKDGLKSGSFLFSKTKKYDGFYMSIGGDGGYWNRQIKSKTLSIEWYLKNGEKNITQALNTIIKQNNDVEISLAKNKSYTSHKIEFKDLLNITINGTDSRITKIGDQNQELFCFVNTRSIKINGVEFNQRNIQPKSGSIKNALITFYSNESGSDRKGIISITNCTFKDLNIAAVFIGNLNKEEQRTTFGSGFKSIYIGSNNFYNYGRYGAMYVRGANQEINIRNNNFTDPNFRSITKTISISSECKYKKDYSDQAIVCDNTFTHNAHSNIFIQACKNIQVYNNVGSEIGRNPNGDDGVFIKIDDLYGSGRIYNNNCLNVRSADGNALMIQGETKGLEIDNNQFCHRSQVRGNGSFNFHHNLVVFTINKTSQKSPATLLILKGLYNNNNLVHDNHFKFVNKTSDKTTLSPNIIEVYTNNNRIFNNHFDDFNKIGIRLHPNTADNLISKNTFNHQSEKSPFSAIFIKNVKTALITKNKLITEKKYSQLMLVNKLSEPSQLVLFDNEGFSKMFDFDCNLKNSYSDMHNKGKCELAIGADLDKVSGKKSLKISQNLINEISNNRRRKLRSLETERNLVALVFDGKTKLKNCKSITLNTSKSRRPKIGEVIILEKTSLGFKEIN